jgi:hypothetical protein
VHKKKREEGLERKYGKEGTDEKWWKRKQENMKRGK